jgi:hypothetical protein
MAGIPKPLTENQQETFEAYTERKNGIGRPLTDKQLADWGSLYAKKNAKPKLTDGAKTFLEKLVWEEITGKREEIKSKYLDKGIMAEEKSITLYSKVTDKIFFKNTQRKTNEFFTGEVDNAQDKIRDIKSSWSFSTFPIREKVIPNKMYEWQLDVYMDLWGIKESELIYCLVDTPFKLINDELRRMDWEHDIMDGNGDIRPDKIDLVVESISNLIYTNEGLEEYCGQSTNIHLDWFAESFKEIPEEIRVKVFEHQYCEERNSQLKTMVSLARDYMNLLLEDMGESILKFNNQLLKIA